MGGIAAGAIILASLFMFLAMTMLFSFAIPAVLVLFLGVWLLGSTNVEYEYIITNNEMDIDKIIGKLAQKSKEIALINYLNLANALKKI